MSLHATEMLERYQQANTSFYSLKEPQTHVDRAYWGDHPPREIVFSTGSARKVMMAMSLLELEQQQEKDLDSAFPVSRAEELNHWFKANVHNGDDSIPIGSIFPLGYFHGVRVSVISAGGETYSNSLPKVEATGKALNARSTILDSLHPENSHDTNPGLIHVNASIREFFGSTDGIVVVGLDTIESVKPIDGLEKRHGKPKNKSDYPKKGEYESNESFQARERAYAEQYLAENFQVGSKVQHIAAISILPIDVNTLKGDAVLSMALIIQYLILQQPTLEMVMLDPESGGGGVSQNGILNSSLQTWLELKPIIDGDNTDTELNRFILLCRIMGMPLYHIMSFIRANLIEEIEVI